MSGSAQHFASFAAYTPPPDESAKQLPQTSSFAAGSSERARPWFPHSSSSVVTASTSYQAGGVPTLGGGESSLSGGLEDQAAHNLWETRFGWRVDVLAAVAYLGGPFTALSLLILETANDFVRFHAYQSALVTTPLLLLFFFESILHFPTFFIIITSLASICIILFLAFRAFQDASEGNLSRFHLPFVGELADRYVGEE